MVSKNFEAFLNGEDVIITAGRVSNEGHLFSSKTNPDSKEKKVEKTYETLVSNYSFTSKKSANDVCQKFFNKNFDEIISADQKSLNIELGFKKHEPIPAYALVL